MAYLLEKKDVRLKILIGTVMGIAAIGAAIAISRIDVLTLEPISDPLLALVIENVAKNRPYTQHVETETSLSDRDIRVVGEYSVNHLKREYSSTATTTLILPDSGKGREKHDFTLMNIAIADDVYIKIETKSELLKKTIPHSVTWRHFKKELIPHEFENIAIAGPILDNLRILDDQGHYLIIKKKYGNVTLFGENLSKYSLSLSKATPPEGTLGVILNRIGNEGLIDIWVDARRAMVRYIHFENGQYHSTTTISTVENAQNVTPPL